MDGLHVESVSQDEGNLLLGTEVREPVPGEDTFDRDNDILAIGRNDLEQGVWASLHITMHHDLPVSVQDADVHRPGVQVDSTVKLMWLGVEAHEILCEGTRHTRAAGVTLLQTAANPMC